MVNAPAVIIYTYIVHVYNKSDPSNSDYWLEYCTIGHLYLLGMIIQVLAGG